MELVLLFSFLLVQTIAVLILVYHISKNEKSSQPQEEDIQPQTKSSLKNPEVNEDMYTPQDLENTVPLDSFLPDFKKKLHVTFIDEKEEDKLTDLEDNG